MSCKKCQPVLAYLIAKYPTLQNTEDECFCEVEE